MKYIEYIITAIAFALAGLFSILQTYVWAGFAYFVLSCFLLLSLFWGGWLIFKYFTTFKQAQAEAFKLFKVHKINQTNISSEQFEENEVYFIKEFRKKTFKDRLFKWLLICFCFALAVSFLLCMIFY